MQKMFFASLLVSLSLTSAAFADTGFKCQGVVNDKENIVVAFNGKNLEVYTVNKAGGPVSSRIAFSNLEFKRNGNFETVKGYALRNPTFPTYAEAMSVIARPYNDLFMSVGKGNLPSTLELLIRGPGSYSEKFKYALDCP